ncbi:sigma-70 family RNA polymerase sigma factor [Catenulispora rubra]|uniref:sigma-70 family RNA polymerase sigma factor n=1 Tax=Catenulispora rubra TaxID=280293 RepID=UPI002B276ED6|nr:sigma-70 family RNA polymerase sigma factor [Catenulispora rubra]
MLVHDGGCRTGCEVGTGPGTGTGSTIDERLALLDREHRAPMLGYVTKLLFSDPSAAEDVVQETFARAWRYLSEHEDVDPAVLRPWLNTVARRLVIDALRAKRARPPEVAWAVANDPGAEDARLSHLMHTDALRSGLLRLSPEHRHVLVELYLRDRTTEDVAARLGVPVGTVRSRSHYAKRALRGMLEER